MEQKNITSRVDRKGREVTIFLVPQHFSTNDLIDKIEKGIEQSALKMEPYLAVISHDNSTDRISTKTEYLNMFIQLLELTQNRFEYRIALVSTKNYDLNNTKSDSLTDFITDIRDLLSEKHPFLLKDSWIQLMGTVTEGIEWCRKNAPPPPRISILFLAADPSDAARLRVGEELRELQEKLQLAKLREQFELEQRMSVRPADISQALLDFQPQIVHFAGHGVAGGALCFENQMGKRHLVEPEALSALFEQFADYVNCVLLNACYSKTQAAAISKHINYVIGMEKAIDDRAAIAFVIGFYQALGAGRTIEDSYKLGCVQIRLHGIPEHLTPVLIKRV